MSRSGTRCHRAERLGRCPRCGLSASPVGTDKHPGNDDGCAAQLEPAGNLAHGLQGEPSGSVSIAALPSAAEFLIPPTLIRLAGHKVSWSPVPSPTCAQCAQSWPSAVPTGWNVPWSGWCWTPWRRWVPKSALVRAEIPAFAEMTESRRSREARPAGPDRSLSPAQPSPATPPSCRRHVRRSWE